MLLSGGYQICSKCVMDTSDPEIHFDSFGVCNYCRDFSSKYPDFSVDRPVFPAEQLALRIDEIKKHGANNEYDCIVGLSGGVDSSYVAYLAKEHDLRPLFVHFDSGWNSELAVSNIESIVSKLGFDFDTYVCDWRVMKDLQLSFFRAGVANCDIPQDHAFIAGLHELAKKHGIKYLVNGHNIATEFVMPMEWGYTSHDLWHIKSIQNAFGSVSLKNYPKYSAFKRFVYFKYINPVVSFNILNFVPYDKSFVKEFLIKELGWRDYGGKHYESRFTKFFQAYYLPEKFGFDKRRAHFSSLIITGQIDRSQALEGLEEPLYDPVDLKEDKEFIARKLGLTVAEFEAVLGARRSEYYDFGYNYLVDFMRRVKHKGLAYAWRYSQNRGVRGKNDC